MRNPVVVVDGMAEADQCLLLPTATLQLGWYSSWRNVHFDLTPLRAAVGSPSPVVADLLDLAAAVYLADLALPRGRNEQFVRDVGLHVPVREPELWRNLKSEVNYLLYLLTGDNIAVTFHERRTEAESKGSPVSVAPTDCDCVCLLSGGVDSLAGAVALLRTGRRPLFVTHRSGNPTAAEAQRFVIEALRRFRPSLRHVLVTLMPRSSVGTLPFPPADVREPSRRSRSLLFMALGIAAAAGLGSTEVYACDNGVLTVALPLSASRVGGLSTRSTHPAVLGRLSALCRDLGLTCQVINPFVYQTKTELIRDVLRPVLSLDEIQATVSCWMTGRRHRQCGGCVPCLLRRVSMLAAGLPDEAYEMDLLARPGDYVGTDAYVNTVDFLSYVNRLSALSNADLLLSAPALLDLQAHNVSVADVVSMLKRFAAEGREVAEGQFPAAARLGSELG